MEGIMLFISIIFIVFGILQIILFFKLWGMTNDVSVLTKNIDIMTRHFCKDELAKIVQNETIPENADFETPDYKEQGEVITFSNGLSGEVTQKFLNWYISTRKHGKSFHTKERAIQVLYEDLSKSN